MVAEQIERDLTFQQIQQGDVKTFEKTFKQLYPMLCGYVYKILKDKDEAEELVQNVFTKLWARREELQISTSLKSYLFTSVHNAALNVIKHHKVLDEYQKAATQDVASGNGKIMEEVFLQQDIKEAIRLLPEQCRKVFILVRFKGKKYKEVAQELEISEKTVENHMSKALKILREALEQYLIVALIFSQIFIN